MSSFGITPMGMILVLLILIVAGAGLFALGFFVGRRRAPTAQRGFDVVSVHDETKH